MTCTQPKNLPYVRQRLLKSTNFVSFHIKYANLSPPGFIKNSGTIFGKLASG